MVVPSGRASTVRSIVTYDGELTEAAAPMAVTVTLDDAVDVSRGDMLVHPAERPHIATEVEALLVWLSESPLVPGRTCWLKQTTRTVVAQVGDVRYGIDVATLDKHPATQLTVNQVGHVALQLVQPICYDAYAINRATGAFILIDRMTNNTVGAGMLLEHADTRGGHDLWHDREVAGRLAHQQSLVTSAEREKRFGQRGATVLVFGVAGSTIGYALERTLFDAGRAVIVLYGPALRHGLSRDLGFTADDYTENLRRLAEVAKLLNDAGLICICAVAAPAGTVPEQVRQVIGTDRLVTVYLSAPIEVCKQRDRTGAYRQGQLVQFPGALAADEASIPVDLEIATDTVTVDESVTRIVGLLRRRQLIP